VVPTIEAWLLADREAFAINLAVAADRLPTDPEGIANVKGCMMELARRSRSRAVREDLLPDPRSGRRVGPGYAQFLIQFINDSWRPLRAATNAPSLDRAMMRLATLVTSSH